MIIFIACALGQVVGISFEVEMTTPVVSRAYVRENGLVFSFLFFSFLYTCDGKETQGTIAILR